MRPLDREAVRRSFGACSTLSGPFEEAPRPRVRFRRTATRRQTVAFACLAALHAATLLAFVAWLLLPSHVPGSAIVGGGGWRVDVARAGFVVVICIELCRIVQSLSLWVLAFAACDPVPMAPPPGLRVALLTTIVPSREPIALVAETLRAMRAVEYDGTVDVWILDEGDDPQVRAVAATLGVAHFSRRGIPELNRPAGEFRARSKAGNYNAWRALHEADYDLVAQIDPDHVPLPCFVERLAGYFADPDVAFVVAPHVYGNPRESLVARGAASQQQLFSGVIQRGGNGLGAPLLVGTNHLYRPAAWQQIGGYQDSIIEDHLTSMRVQGTRNPASGRRWKGIYTPDVVAIGEGPASWTDYFSQQTRWCYGTWQIVLGRKLREGIDLDRRQRLFYWLLQFYYPSAGVSLLLGNLATATYLLLGVGSMRIDPSQWAGYWLATMASWFFVWRFLRRFNLAAHERAGAGASGLLLTLLTGPVYLAAGLRALFRRPLRFVVTPKGALRSRDRLSSFRASVAWCVAGAAGLVAGTVAHHGYPALRAWAFLAVAVGALPPLLATLARLAGGTRRHAAATRRELRAARRRPMPVPAPAAVQLATSTAEEGACG